MLKAERALINKNSDELFPDQSSMKEPTKDDLVSRLNSRSTSQL
jgi:hypothetical protein